MKTNRSPHQGYSIGTGLTALATIIVTLGLFAQRADAVSVALELSLVFDVSGSISTTEYNLQRQGYHDAFSNAAVQTAIESNTGGIAVNVVQFSSNAAVAIDWVHIETAAEASAFGDSILGMARSGSIGSQTDIEDGINLAAGSFAGNGFESVRGIIDVAGDGEQNNGGDDGDLIDARNAALTDPEVDAINGLAILTTTYPNLDDYYDVHVKGGAEGFVVVAGDFADFTTAITQKILLETTPPPPPPGEDIPEPSRVLLGCLGLAGAFLGRRRRQA